MNGQTRSSRLSTAKNIGLWVLQVLLAAAFLMAGFAKLSGQPAMVETFDKLGAGQWVRYVTGGIEVVSAILLLVPRLTPVGAALLVCTMIGAVLTHLLTRSPSVAPQPPKSARKRNPHSPAPAARGFLHERLSYACRRPKP